MKSRNREINVFSMSALDLFASALGAFILISIVLMPYFLRVEPEELARLRQDLAQARADLAETRQRLRHTKNELAQCTEREAACREERETLQQEVARLHGELARTQAAAAETRERLQRAQSELARCGEREAACREELEALRRDAAGLQQDAAALQQCRAALDSCEQKLSRTFLAIVIQWSTARHDVDLHVIDVAGEEFYYERKAIRGRPGELSADTVQGPGVEIWEVSEAPAGEYQVLYKFYDDHGNPDAAIVKGGVYHRDGHDRLRERSLTGRDRKELVAVVTVHDDGRVEISER